MKLKEKGFTLTELLIGTAILGVIACVCATIYIQGFRSWRQSSAQIEVQGQARIILDMIEKDIRQAKASTITISQYNTTQPKYSKISMTNVRNSSIAYYQQGPDLHRTVDGKDALVFHNIQNILFIYPDTSDGRIISISLTMEKATYEGGAKTIMLSVDKVRVRNP